MHPVIILAPLLPEARAVARAFSLKGQFLRKTESNGEVTVAMVGPRASHLPQLEGLTPRGVILAGLGGGLAEGVGLGNLVVDRRISPLTVNVPIHFGKICTSPYVVTNPADKMALHRQTGALAVDMEYDIARAFAESLTVPFLAIRAISDTVHDTLDPALLGLIDGDGRPRPSRAIGMLARNPAKLAMLLRIAKASRLALSHLAAGVAAIVDSGWPDGPGKG
ncbi:MAG TPA: hypothetical protein VHM90_03605 [Phycisphaerae bacterium]|jgi:adenosylhomocysteine nucleosidase|nr:hypothetical protein [Phycisphaerae bacterium]